MVCPFVATPSEKVFLEAMAIYDEGAAPYLVLGIA